MDWDDTLNALLGLLGSKVFVELRAPGEIEIATMRGTLAAGDDLGEFERTEGVGGPEHDRLLFSLREHPFPEGFYMDRRTFETARWHETGTESELRVALSGGVVLAVIEDTSEP